MFVNEKLSVYTIWSQNVYLSHLQLFEIIFRYHLIDICEKKNSYELVADRDIHTERYRTIDTRELGAKFSKEKKIK